MLSEARLNFLEKTISAKGITKKLVLHWEGFFLSDLVSDRLVLACVL